MTEDEVKNLIRDFFNGRDSGERCIKGRELETMIKSARTELTEEKAERLKKDDQMFEKFDETNRSISNVKDSFTKGIVIATFVMVIATIVTKLI